MKRLTALLLSLVLLLCCFATAMAEFGDFSEKFESYFLLPGEEPYVTDRSYQSDELCIQISTMRAYNSDVYIADIYVRSTENLQRGLSNNKWKGAQQRVATIAANNNAILALSGDNGAHLDAGWAFANGKMVRKTANKKRDLMVMYRSGEMKVYPAGKVTTKQLEAEADVIWQSFLFGPSLLDANGHALSSYNTNVGPANPRAVIGYYEPGHYCLVQVDGRSTASQLESGKKNTGMKMKELGAFIETLGCTAAYNLDGGQSAMMWFNGQVISNPYEGGRNLYDVIIIKELN